MKFVAKNNECITSDDIFLGVIFWILESALMSNIFHLGTFNEQVFTPTGHEVWHRLLVFSFMMGFAFYADSAMLR